MRQHPVTKRLRALRGQVREALHQLQERYEHTAWFTDAPERTPLIHEGEYVIFAETRRWCSGVREDCPCGSQCCACRHMERRPWPYAQARVDATTRPLTKRWQRMVHDQTQLARRRSESRSESRAAPWGSW